MLATIVAGDHARSPPVASGQIQTQRSHGLDTAAGFSEGGSTPGVPSTAFPPMTRLPRRHGTSPCSLGCAGALLLTLVGVMPVAARPIDWGGSRPVGASPYATATSLDDFAPEGYEPSPDGSEPHADGYGRRGYSDRLYGNRAYGDRPYGSQGDSGPGYQPRDPAGRAQLRAQAIQRCNIGRLVGGLVGGGVGYAASRRDGRSWAVPLGALLGQQIGCNAGNGRTPLPW